MNRRRIQFLALALLVIALAVAGVVLAAGDDGLMVGWFRLGPGGLSFCTEGYSLTSAIGQAAAGQSSGGSYSLVGGIEMEAVDCRSISLPVILR